MSRFLGPVDTMGCVPARQQTRVAAFLMSCHGALARQLAVALIWERRPTWHMELNTQLYREADSNPVAACYFMGPRP